MNASLRRHIAPVIALFAAACSTTAHENSSSQTPSGKYAAAEGTSFQPLTPEQRLQYETAGERFAISAQGVATAKAALAILKKGGNLMDAAVAASFAIAVERPHSSGLGGGGFMLYRDGRTKKVHALDFRERAPLAASERMFLDEKGEVVKDRSITGHLAVAAPSHVAAMIEAHRRFGRLPLRTVLAPAIELAEKGFPVYGNLAMVMNSERDKLALFPNSKRVFLRDDGTTYKEGEIFAQPELAKTLKRIASNGRNGFYKGPVAKALLAEMAAGGGLITQKDLDAVKPRWLEPVKGDYRGNTVYGMPLPSSGGILVQEILNIIENDDVKALGFHSPTAVHLMAAAMQQAFADRAAFLGDPAFVKAPVPALTSKGYAALTRSLIQPGKARSADAVAGGNVQPFEKGDHIETTHISLMDSRGGMIALTQTINDWFGSGVVAGDTGITLNDTMDDFAAKPGAANMFGAVGSVANAVAPGKAPLSSMSPTLVLSTEGTPLMAVGAPGGTRIINCVAQTIVNTIDFDLPLFEAISRPRFHHQWHPDRIELEQAGLPDATESSLREMGYTLAKDGVPCRVMAVTLEGKHLHAVSDPRGYGAVEAD